MKRSLYKEIPFFALILAVLSLVSCLTLCEKGRNDNVSYVALKDSGCKMVTANTTCP